MQRPACHGRVQASLRKVEGAQCCRKDALRRRVSKEAPSIPRCHEELQASCTSGTADCKTAHSRTLATHDHCFGDRALAIQRWHRDSESSLRQISFAERKTLPTFPCRRSSSFSLSCW